jgi:hypothetical protein
MQTSNFNYPNPSSMATAAPSGTVAAAAPENTSLASSAGGQTKKGGGPIYIDTQHDDMIHDAQMDYYGTKLATCSSGKYHF